jgi:glycosyltransferase involved in cell wall biosynthesis
MKFAVISSSPFIKKADGFYAYSPYMAELGIWAQHVDEVGVMCPVWTEGHGLLVSKAGFPVSEVFAAREFNVKSAGNLLKAIRHSFYNFRNIYRAMRWADHIHLRCPGNIGLMGCFVQMLFPGKPKTAKYAGNWDPKAKQPLSYRIQRWILSNTVLTRNMQALVYGEWPGSTKNVKPFFTASYAESEIRPPASRSFSQDVNIIFVGTLAPGKRPLYAIRLYEMLREKGVPVLLSVYGHGREKKRLEQYIADKGLSGGVKLMGNKSKEDLIEVYRQSHFVVLPSQSEGWPKAVAEGMFWGCVPLVTGVSCVPFMLGNGSRGLLLTMDLETDARNIAALISDHDEWASKIAAGVEWSQKYTVDLFAEEIKSLLAR